MSKVKPIIKETETRRTEQDVESYIGAWYRVFNSLHKTPIQVSFENGKVAEVKNNFVGPEFGFSEEQVNQIHSLQMAHRNTMRMFTFHDYGWAWADYHDLGLIKKAKLIGIITDYTIASEAVMDIRLSSASPVVLVDLIFNEEEYTKWLEEMRSPKPKSESELSNEEN